MVNKAAKLITVEDGLQEMKIMHHLKQFPQHENVISSTMDRILEDEHHYWLALPYYVEGDLLSILLRNKSRGIKLINSFKNWKSYALQLINGLNYIFESGFVHRDLSLENMIKFAQLIKILLSHMSRFVNN